MKFLCLAALLTGCLAVPAAAQDRTVSAADPQGLVSLFELAGYDPELSTDSYGDPRITLEVDGGSIDVIFYGCEEESRTNCDSLQLSAGFDAPDGITPDMAIRIGSEYRFAQVSLDDENDPYIRWDIVTGSGIPASVLLQSLRYFEDTIADASALIFPDEEAATTSAAAQIARAPAP